MERDKIIIIALIAIIAILLVSIIAIMPNIMKKDTQVTINSNSTLNEGDSIKIRLIDENGVAIANQNVNISINNGTVTDYHSITTDNQGIGKLELDKKNVQGFSMITVENETQSVICIRIEKFDFGILIENENKN